MKSLRLVRTIDDPYRWIAALRASIRRARMSATTATGETLLRRASFGGRKGRRAEMRIQRGEFR